MDFDGYAIDAVTLVARRQKRGIGGPKAEPRPIEKVGIVASDKMEKTVVVRVDRLIRHPKYRRYVRRTS